MNSSLVNQTLALNGVGECGYLELMRHIMVAGERKMERNGATRKVVGASLRFDLRNHPFPLFQTKKMYITGILAELEWFLSGCTDIRWLWRRNVHIWDMDWQRYAISRGHAADEVARQLELGKKYHTAEVNSLAEILTCTNHPMFDMGPIYGAQWRGDSSFRTYHSDAAEFSALLDGSVDQFGQLIKSLNEGGTRRDIVCSWNPNAIPSMALPPCHVLMQFHRSPDGDLDCTMYQRSADMFLGVPFNVASYATLLIIVARLTGCRERELTISFGDAHIYEAHFDAVQQQIERFNHAYMMYDRAVSEREAFVPSTKASMDVTVSSQYDREAITPELYMDESGVIDSGNYRMFLWPERVSIDIAVRNYDPMAAIKAPLL